MILYHSLFDLLFINFCLKWCIKRIRPISSLFKDDKYFGLTDFKFTSRWAINQSFTSSHVSFTYSVFYLFWHFTSLNLLSYSYLIALIIVFNLFIGYFPFSKSLILIFVNSNALSTI